MTEPEQPVVTVPLRAGPREDAIKIAAAHVADERPEMGARRGPLPDESFTYPCIECGTDWPCDVVLIGRLVATLPSTAEYNAVCEDREMWRRLAGEAQAEAAALAVEAVRPETDIDEERLARALTVAEWPPSIYPAGYGDRRWQRDFAASLAAAYRATPLAERPE